jgi:hypothetical protein
MQDNQKNNNVGYFNRTQCNFNEISKADRDAADKRLLDLIQQTRNDLFSHLTTERNRKGLS